MIRTLRAGALAAGALALVFSLTGCFGGSPTATPTPDAHRRRRGTDAVRGTRGPAHDGHGLVARPERSNCADEAAP